MPSTGWPANGSSTPGVKIRIATSPPARGASRKTVSATFSSRATRAISAASNGRPSTNTPSWLPSSGSEVKTSHTK